MLGIIIGIVITVSILFAIAAVAAYVIVRFWFVRLAERISAQIAAQIEHVADEGVARLREQGAAGLLSHPRASQAIEASAAIGIKIRDFAAARGLSIQEARIAFLAKLDGVARVMDRAIPVPLVGGVGLDALLGLIPYVGDVISAVVAGSIILNALQYGIPKSLVAKMVANMFVDVLFGAVPLLGDIFDVVFKANTRNVALLQAYLDNVKIRTAQSAVTAAAT